MFPWLAIVVLATAPFASADTSSGAGDGAPGGSFALLVGALIVLTAIVVLSRPRRSRR